MLRKVPIILILIFIVSTFNGEAAIGPAQPPVGVPLDGGLLAILAGAGIAYFIKRKKKLEE